jgi:hypothetical protein
MVRGQAIKMTNFQYPMTNEGMSYFIAKRAIANYPLPLGEGGDLKASG